MKRYAFLVRGINVGGRHKVVMEEFCHELKELGMSNVSSYINSGNFFLQFILDESGTPLSFREIS